MTSRAGMNFRLLAVNCDKSWRDELFRSSKSTEKFTAFNFQMLLKKTIMFILDWTFTLNQLKPVIVCCFIAQRKQPREDPENWKCKLWPLQLSLTLSDESFLFVTYPLASTGRILSVLMCLCRTWIAEFWVWIQMLGLLTQLPVLALKGSHFLLS